jgi:signal transduction histidine kinase
LPHPAEYPLLGFEVSPAVAMAAGSSMISTRRALRCRLCEAALAGLLIGTSVPTDTEAAAPKRVLVLHSFGRDFAPFDTIASVFRAELVRSLAEPITFIETNLDSSRRATDLEQRAFIDYLNARFDEGAPDVVVTIGAPAGRFYLESRTRLFPSVPAVIGALDERRVSRASLAPRDLIVAGTVDVAGAIDNILQVMPDTETIAVVIGASDLERIWFRDVQRDLASFANRVRFIWLNDLSLEQMEDRVAHLPARSALLYGLLIVDAAGVLHERQDALVRLHAASNAPIFGLFETELGSGIVGGPYTSQKLAGERIAAGARQLLTGAAIQPTMPLDARYVQPVAYDWRELSRWRIDESRLPPESEIRFKPQSMFEEHPIAVTAALLALALQTLLIFGLVSQRVLRRKAERVARSLGGRLVTAHEDERRRIARELHDDVSQRLASLAIEAASLEARGGPAGGETARSIREGLVELSDDVHALSYRLHPSVIEELGLGEALQIECDRVASDALRVELNCADVRGRLPAGTALCLFRVAQESLRNVVRHARASSVNVRVVDKDGGISLAVRDNGRGFDVSATSGRASLGLASMRERVRVVGGTLTIESSLGRGTVINAWIPLQGAT